MTTPTEPLRCVLRHPDGRWLYLVPDLSRRLDGPGGKRVSVEADGVPMTPLLKADWWAAASEATVITETYEQHDRIVGWEIGHPDLVSVRNPPTLTVQEFRERNDDSLYDVYSSITEPVPPAVVAHEGPWLVLDGNEPPGPGEPPWVAKLPYELSTRPEFRHMFPGCIPGLHDDLLEVFKAMPHVRFAFAPDGGRRLNIEITVEVLFERPVMRWKPDIGRSGKPLKSGRQVQEFVTRRFEVLAPRQVHGATYREALAEREHLIEHYAGMVASASVKACNACGGSGHTPESGGAS